MKTIFYCDHRVCCLTGSTGRHAAREFAKALHTEKDLFDFVWVANPQVSPDGTRVAFTRVTVDDKRTKYETSIWIAATNRKEAPIRNERQARYTAALVAPTARTSSSFGRRQRRNGNPKPGQLAMLSLAGGEASTIYRSAQRARTRSGLRR